MPSRQNDKLKKLLGMKEKRVPDMVREREMNDVRNYNRNQQARVFENEKRQVARYGQDTNPESAKDIGSSFKLQVYTLKLQALLQAKMDAIKQVELVIGTANRGGDPDAPPDQQAQQAPQGITLGASQLRDARLAPYVNTIFGKAELVNSFNETMAFIKTYMGDILSDDRVRDTVYTSLLTPLSQQLVMCANEYPPFYTQLQVRGQVAPNGQVRTFAELGDAGKNDARAKAIFRGQAVQVFSVLMCCAENINIQALRPITAKDVEQYAKDNDVDEIIRSRGPAVGPLREGALPTPALPSGQSIIPGYPPEPPPAPAPPRYPPGPPTADPAPPQQQGQQGQPIQQATLQSTVNLLTAFAQANPLNVASPLQFRSYGQDGKRVALQAIRDFNQNADGTFKFPPPTVRMLSDARKEIGRAGQPQQGQQTPPRAVSPTGQQGGPAPAGPAVDTRRDLRDFARMNTGMTGITTNQSVCPILPAPFNNIDPNSDMGQVVDSIVYRIRGEEDAQDRVFNAKNAQDVDFVMGNLSPTRQQMWETEMPNEATRRELVRAVIKAMRDLRIRFANEASQSQRRPDFEVNARQQPQQFLYGLGKKTNAKVFLRGCGVPEDIIGTAMMRHGLPDDAEVGDLEGSGILDTLKNFAGSVADSASGWFDTIKANMPTMSDVRRAVGKIVPDSMSEYVPSGLKRTFGDKAKDFFGFGMSGGEFQADPYRATHARHREPFDNFFDNRGYRQGAVQRMTTMFVPDWEISSGLHRLKGGDQLSDHDPELLRRQDHHDVSLYKPAVIQQPIHGYGHDGDEDEQYEGGLKQRLRKPIAIDVIGRPYRKDPMFVHRVEDHDEFQPRTIGDEGIAHYEELEKPADMDEDPNPFRVRTENHKVNTGKMKKVTYHTK